VEEVRVVLKQRFFSMAETEDSSIGLKRRFQRKKKRKRKVKEKK